MGAKAFQLGVASTMLVSAAFAGANDDFPPAMERAEEIREVNRCALEQLPAGAVPSRGTVRIEAEIVPTRAGQEVELRHWDVSPVTATTNRSSSPAASKSTLLANAPPPPASTAGAAALSNGALPTNSATARTDATMGSAIQDRIVNRPLPIGRDDEAP